MSDYDFPAGLWVLRQLDKEAKLQGAVLTAHDKWSLKQSQQESSINPELTKRTVSLIRSAITRAKTNPLLPVVTINPQLTIPVDWFEGYKSIFISGETSVLGDCLQKAFKGCPEWGETEPWASPDFSPKARHASSDGERQSPRSNPPSSSSNSAPAPATASRPTGVAGIVLSSVSIFIALIGGGALAVPFGLYGISQGRKFQKAEIEEDVRGRGTLAVFLGAAGIALGVILLFVKISQST